MNETIDGFVSHVTDDGRLYCHLQGPGNDKLYEMQQELMTIYAQVNICSISTAMLIAIRLENYSEYMSSPTRLSPPWIVSCDDKRKEITHSLKAVPCV